MDIDLIFKLLLLKNNAVSPRQIYKKYFLSDNREFYKEDGWDVLRVEKDMDKSGISLKKVKRYQEDIEKYCIKYNCQMVSIFSTEYPDALCELFDPPLVIYVRGDHKILNDKRNVIGMVGSRNISNYTKRVIRKFLSEVNNSNLITVSGLAYGVDIWVHRESVKNQIPTIAVLGTSFEKIYPYYHSKDVEKIIDFGGAIVTEYLPQDIIRKYNFAVRNRIISGLSKSLVVYQARRKSGSLITADISLNLGRDVFVVPHGIFEEEAKGGNDWLQRGTAHLLTDVVQLGLEKVNNHEISNFPAIQKIIELDEINVISVMKIMKCDEINAIKYLTDLELEGILYKNIIGNYLIK